MPLFTVVIPTYNRSRVLQRAVASVLAQSFADLELIVVDDGSTDDTRERMSALPDPRVRYLEQPNGGAARARNAGAASARGRLLTFLDSDDEADPHWLERYSEAFLAGADIVCCGCWIVDPGMTQSTQIVLPRDLGPVLDNQRGLFTQGGVFALRRAIFESVGGYAEACRANQNTELSYRVVPAAHGQGWRIDNLMEPLVRYHKHSQGSIRDDSEAVLQGTRYLLEEHAALVRRDRRLYANYCAVAGVCAVRLGRHREGRRYLLRSARAYPARPRAWLRAGAALALPISARAWQVRRGRHAV